MNPTTHRLPFTALPRLARGAALALAYAVAGTALSAGAQQPEITGIQPGAAGEDTHLTFTGEPGFTYEVQSSSNLQSWAPVQQLGLMTGVANLDLPGQATGTQPVFYRLKKEGEVALGPLGEIPGQYIVQYADTIAPQVQAQIEDHLGCERGVYLSVQCLFQDCRGAGGRGVEPDRCEAMPGPG